MNNICMICTQKNKGDMELQHLERIYEMVRHTNCEIPEALEKKFPTHDLFRCHLHCQYGINCSHLQLKENRIHVIGGQIEKHILAFIYEKNGTNDCHTLFRLCQGYFPCACRYIERVKAYINKNEL